MHPCRLLLVEDNPDDVFMFTRAAAAAASEVILSVAGDPEEAIGIAEGVAKAGKPLTLIVTDLKMPKATGIELIEKLRAKSEFQKIPIILLSSSDEARDVRDAYQAGANVYMVKPSGFAPYKDLLAQIVHFWEKREIPLSSPFVRTI